MTTALMQIAALKMQLRELEATPCASCGHRLGGHSSITRTCVGVGGKQCSCASFSDPGERLALK